MALFDDNPVVQAADLHNVAQTGNSFFEDTADFITKGIPLAVGSGVYSMLNTGVSLGNSLGGDFGKFDFARDTMELDSDLGKYYQQHEEGVDLGGFVATSFVPGLAGMKALKMIQAGGLGKSAQAATSFFKSAETKYLDKALSSVQTETNAVFKMLDGNKIAAMAAGVGEQTLQAASFETAVMVTMNQNPTVNKDDQSYFKSLLYNTPDILAGALIGGGIGGAINAIGISGKIKSGIRARDKEDFPSLNIKEVGLSDIDPGTSAAIDFMWLKGREKQIKELADSGALNERQVANYAKTQEQKSTELATRIREELTGGDADLAKSVWNHFAKLTTEGGTDAPEEVGLRLLGAAKNIARITEEDQILTGEKVLLGDQFLGERHAKNMLERARTKNKLAPQSIEPTDLVSLEEAKLAGYELFKDSSGNFRVIPGTKYASELKKTTDARKHDFIVKLSGSEAGNIAETAFPVLGDIGKVTYEKGVMKAGGQIQVVKPYNPLENTPLESNKNFLFEKLSPEIDADLEEFVVEHTNLPRLEKAVIEDANVTVSLPNGSEEIVDADILRQLKFDRRQELVNAGHSYDQIARELNVSQEFAERGSGEFMLGRIEDHTGPIHAKFTYNTAVVPDGNYLRGVSDLNDRIRVAKEHNLKASAFILGPAFQQLPQTQGTMLGINTIPELGNMIKSADESYGSFGQLMQYVGKTADGLFRQRSAEVIERISAYHHQIEQSEELTRKLNIVVAKLRSGKEPVILDDTGLVMPKRLLKAKDDEYDDLLQQAMDDGSAFKIAEPEIFQYLKETRNINANRAEQFNSYFGAKGSATSFDPEVLYVPPINTRRYPFVAFVKETSESEFRPSSVITASDASSLEAKIRSIKQEFGDVVSVYTKDDVANFYKMQGEYESGLLLGNSTVDTSLKKRGLLSDFVPRTDKEILNDFTNWHIQSEQTLVRNAIELNYAQEFAELRAMGQNFTEYQKSRFGRELSDKEYAQLRKDNPYEKYIGTALAVSNYAKYDSVWGKLNGAVEGFGQSMFKAWDSVFNRANKGEIDWITANKEAESYGLRAPYKDVLREVINPVIADKKIVEPIVAKINAALATLVLRLDPLNSIVNILGTPALIAAELRSISKNLIDPDRVGKLSQLLTDGIPGSKTRMPSMMELTTKAMTNFVMDDGKYLKYYQEIGAVQNDLQLYKTVLDASQLKPEILAGGAKTLTQWSTDVLKKTSEVGATLSGNNLSERMVRFIAADIMRQLGETAGIQGAELSSYINTFVNRVHGNYVASQRPHLFQGAVGQAISLFQTYQFNVMQNMVRFVETNDKTAVAALLGMQNTIFGLQGNPAFYLLNSAIGNANREHKDLVTGTYATVGEDMSRWMLYGLGSNALKTNLYNRGDLTPRYVTVIPTNVTDVPAVSIPAKLLNNVIDTFSNIMKGGSIKQSILEGLAQNGVNRPIAGAAQLAMGYRTTSQGNLLTAYNEIDTMTAASKIFGGEELNRALAIDNYYRQIAYKKKDAEKIADLGEVVKAKIRSGESVEDTDMTELLTNYSRAGGRPSSFNRFMAEQYKNASKSQIGKMKSSLGSQYSRNLGLTMGAEDEDALYLQPSP